MSKPAKGFSLVELLVVITILTILAVIGLAIFNNLSKYARDAKRQSDLDAIAKALEVHYRITDGTCEATGATIYLAGTYCPLYDGWFSGGKVPKDPWVDSTPYYYAYGLAWNHSNSPVPDPTSPYPGNWGGGGACCGFDYRGITDQTVIDITPGLDHATNWKLCAWLETTENVICRASSR